MQGKIFCECVQRDVAVQRCICICSM